MRNSWECPACGRRYAKRNQWHSCGNVDLDATLAKHTDAAVAVYWAVESALAVPGEVRVHPQRTRIAFISTMTFASVRLARRWADLSFITADPVDDARIRRIELYGPTSWGHTVRLSSSDEVDDDVRGWLAEARRRGDRETLDPHAPVAPLVGHALEVLLVPLRAVVAAGPDGPALAIPRHAAEAFAEHPLVRVRIRREVHRGRVESGGGGATVVLDGLDPAELGLGEGDPVDLTLAADL